MPTTETNSIDLDDDDLSGLCVDDSPTPATPSPIRTPIPARATRSAHAAPSFVAPPRGQHEGSTVGELTAAAERRLLGAVLIDGEASLDAIEAAGITPACFFSPANRVIMEAMRHLRHSRQPVAAWTLLEALTRADRLNEVGGREALNRIAVDIPTTITLARDIEAVREFSLRRKLAVRNSLLAEATADLSCTSDELLRIAESVAEAARSGPAVTAEWGIVTAAEIAKNPPPTPPELMHGLLYRGGTVLMSGASKSMKTYTMIAAGLAVAAGRQWMGFKCTAAPVVYLNLELQDFAMSARIKAVASAAGIEPPASFNLVNLRGKLVNIDAIEARLSNILEKTGAGLVIIDPHYKISSASGVEENSNDEQGLLLYRLENAVCKSGAALMLAHHFSKGDKSQAKAIDRAAGGGALARWPDVVMTLTEHEEEGCATAEFALRNFAPVPPFVVRWAYPVWARDEGVNPALLKKAGRKEDYPPAALLAKLKDGMSRKEWREASGWSDSTFKRKHEDLIAAGRVRLFSGCFFLNSPESPESPK